ncbi:MAG: hypothetical protein HRT73_06960 [Flavobacteriales bacterium]|nr:hypothetical protein [Flavobacteriales bacterium]NQX97606.1 hypothetical protein [Flavobacteriales bacterium]
MKKIVFLFISALFILSCDPNNSSFDRNNTDWNKFQLKGDVKSFREIKFLAVDNFSIISNGEKVKHLYNKEVLFNLDGNKIEKNDYIPDGTLANRTVYLYKKGVLVEYNNYDSQGMLFGTGRYETNVDHQVTTLNYKTTDGRYNWSESYQYDNSGNITEIKRFKTEKAIDKKELYAFNTEGNIVSSEFHKGNNLISKSDYNYDEEGNFEQLNFSNSIVYSYKYNYDAKGNWIKKIIFENDNPSGILIRDIEYFD